jgi:hypothetical protein
MVAFSRDGEPNAVTIAKDGQKAHKIAILAIAHRANYGDQVTVRNAVGSIDLTAPELR